MLDNYLQPETEEIVEEVEVGELWFHHDGTRAHTAQSSLKVLREIFPGCASL